MTYSKIIATLGPASCDSATIRDLLEAGMDVARLNGSHADLDWHSRTIATLRKVAPSVPILLDIPGKKIRTIQLAHEPSFKAGDRVILTTDLSHDGHEKVPVNYAGLHLDLRRGNIVVADDGTLRFTVDEVVGTDIICRAEVDGQLKSRKGINVPYVKLGTQLVTDRDHRMVDFARSHGVDFIGISFVESAAHVEAIRELTGGSSPMILAKVETQGGLDNLREICAASDAIMIDRGDLSVETNLDTIALSQKIIIAAAREEGKPVVVATEMLHTMIENQFPTKAEVSDITNAVLDGCTATMLSGETAIGRFPSQVVRTMRQIADASVQFLQSRTEQEYIGTPDRPTVPHVVEDAISMICRSLPITKIVAVTKSGFAARVLAARRPRQPILAVSNDPAAARCFNLYYGTEGVFVDVPFSRTSTDHIASCLEALWRQGKLNNSDMILVTAVGYPKSGNRMNLVQIHIVSDLVEMMGWTL